jgi:hypothetical protein
MTEDLIADAISRHGPVLSIYMKKRHNNPSLNLGHGILSTNSKILFDFLVGQRFLIVNSVRLEFREYFTSEEISNIKNEQSKRTLIIKGFPVSLSQ